MLREVGCTHVIIGHSERRQYFGETDETVAKKVAGARAHGLTPIMCVGEPLEEREAGQTLAVVERQCAADCCTAMQLLYEPSLLHTSRYGPSVPARWPQTSKRRRCTRSSAAYSPTSAAPRPREPAASCTVGA